MAHLNLEELIFLENDDIWGLSESSLILIEYDIDKLLNEVK